MGGTNRNISVRAVGDFSNLSQGLQRAQSEIQSFGDRVKEKFKEIGEIGRGIKDVFEVFKMVGESVGELANRAAELDGGMSSLNRTLGSSAVGYMEWANSTAKSFGISKMSAIEYGKSIAMLLGDVYKDQGQLAAATEQIMQGGAVIAAKTGKSQQEVYEELNSALMGHAAAVKSLDINIMENALVHSQAYKQIANGTPWAQLSAEQQQYIRVTELNRQIQQKFGDTIGNGMDARLMLFKGALDDLKTGLAEAFMPILYRVLPILTTFLSWIQTAINYVAAFFQVLFGYSGIHAGMSAGVNQHTQAVNALGDAYSNAGKKASAAHKAISGGSTPATHNAGIGGAKNGKNTLNHNGTASFDQVHTLTKNTNAEGGAGGGAGGAGAAGADAGIPDLGNSISGIGDKVNGVADNIEKFREKVGGFVNGVKAFFDQVGTFIKQHKDVIISVLAGLAAGFATFLIGSNWAAIVEGMGLAFQALVAAISAVSAPIVAIAALIGLFVGNLVYLWQTNEKFRDSVLSVWNEISSFLKKVVTDTWNIVKSVWDKYGASIVNGLAGFMKSIQDIILNIWNSFLHPFLTSALDTLKNLWDNHLKGLVQAVVEFVAKLVDGALQIWDKFISPVINWLIEKLGPIFAQVFASIFKVIGQLVGVAADVAKGLFKALGGIVDFLVGVFTGDWNKAWKGIKEIFSGVFSSFEAIVKTPVNAITSFLSGPFTRAVSSVFSGFTNIVNGVKTTFSGIIDFITGVFTGNWSKAWNGVKEIFKGVFESLYGFVKTPLNWIVDAINSVISGIDGLSFTAPDWVPGIGGKSIGFNIPRIPHLATGGITNGPTLAMIGDNPGGQEVVSPLSNLKDILSSAVATAVMQAMQFSNTKAPTGDLVIKIDGTAFARVVNPYLDREQSRVGSAMIRTT